MAHIIRGVINCHISPSISVGPQTYISVSVVDRSNDNILGNSSYAGTPILPLEYQVAIDEQPIRENPTGNFDLVVRMEVDHESDFVTETSMPIIDDYRTQSFVDKIGNEQHFSYTILDEIDVELASSLRNSKLFRHKIN
jgi:hypothetical protein